MTTPSDPFATPPQPPAGQGAPAPQWGAPQYPDPSQSAPPPPPVPGLPVPGQSQPIPTSVAAQFYASQGGGSASNSAKTLATWTIILTGAATFLLAVSSILAAMAADELATYSTTAPDDLSGVGMASSLISLLAYGAAIGAFLSLGFWWQRIRNNLNAIGHKVDGPPAVEWWGWFVPLANFVLPFLGMRAISKRSVGVGILLGWWLSFCAVFITIAVISVVALASVDYQTGEITGDLTTASAVSNSLIAVFITISWAFLAVIVNKVTKTHNAPSA